MPMPQGWKVPFQLAIEWGPEPAQQICTAKGFQQVSPNPWGCFTARTQQLLILDRTQCLQRLSAERRRKGAVSNCSNGDFTLTCLPKKKKKKEDIDTRSLSLLQRSV
jgi:hypothetical protein